MKRLILLTIAVLFAFQVSAQQKIIGGEYFWDTDPGIGKGTSFIFSQKDTLVNETIEFSTTGIKSGLHNLMYRTKSDSGYWSHFTQLAVFVSTKYESPIVQAEYFWDDDPGFGKGTLISLSSLGDSDTTDFDIDVPGGFSLGNHVLAIRVKSIGGAWSLFHLEEITLCTEYGPVSKFEINRTGALVEFVNKSVYGKSFHWDFGDGKQDTARNPLHFFPNTGIYDVLLTSSNVCGSDTQSLQITVGGIQAVSPGKAGQNGLITGGVFGQGFVKDSSRVRFVLPGDTLYPESHAFTSSSLLIYSLNLADAKEGVYKIEYLVSDTPYYSFEGALEVEPFREPQLSIRMEGPWLMRAGRFYEQQIVLENKGNVDAMMVPVVFKTVNIANSGQIGIFFDYDNLTDEVDTLKKLREQFIDAGGDSSFVNSFVHSYDTAGSPGIKMLSFIVPRLKPGITKYRVTLVIYGNDIGIETKAFIGEPLLSSDARELRGKKEETNGADCLAKAVLCTINLAGNVLDLADGFSSVVDCIRDLYNLVDNSVKDAYGKSVTEQILEATTGGDASKLDSKGFLKAVNISQKPINYTMSIASTIISCGKFIAETAIPGGKAFVTAVDKATGAGTDFNLASKLNTVKKIVTEDLKCYLDLLKSCTGKDLTWLLSSLTSRDPNAKYGPGLAGSPYINPDKALPYLITFENVKSASAAAQEVFVYDTLDAAVYDFNSFRFLSYGWDTLSFGANTEFVSGDEISFTDVIDITPAHPNYVKVKGSFNRSSGIAMWSFTTLDTLTLQLTRDAIEGFLPPNKTSPEGEGYVSFDIGLKLGLKEGTVIKNRASIVFDANQPIRTNSWENLFDITPPVSAVNSLPLTRNDSVFTISWSGTDNLSGIKTYDIYINSDGGNFIKLLSNTNLTSFEINVQPGILYGFYSVARDSAGNVEEPPVFADATTRVIVGLENLNPADFKSDWLGQNIPNPANGQTAIPYYLEDNKEVRFEIYNSSGRLIQQFSPKPEPKIINSLMLDLHHYPRGLYYYRMVLPQNVLSRKMMVK